MIGAPEPECYNLASSSFLPLKIPDISICRTISRNSSEVKSRGGSSGSTDGIMAFFGETISTYRLYTGAKAEIRPRILKLDCSGSVYRS